MQTLVTMGELKAVTGDAQGALLAFGRALSIEPGNAKANYFVGTLYERAGDDAEAESHYRKALETEPQLVEPRLLLGNSLMRRKEYPRPASTTARSPMCCQRTPRSCTCSAWPGSPPATVPWAHPVLARGA